MQRKVEDVSYVTVRLNKARHEGWAVIGVPSGSIAMDGEGRLLMKLDQAAAAVLANRLNARPARPFGAVDPGHVTLSESRSPMPAFAANIVRQ